MATSDYSSTFTSSSDGYTSVIRQERFQTVAVQGDCIFQSPAQIMVRQDIGWEPMGLGGLSRIEIKKRPSPISKDGLEYFIEAYKINSGNEKNLNLECKLDRDTSYHRISPTFHCWTTKTSKIGLTFDTFEAAENFERLFNQILKRFDREVSSCHDKSQTKSPLISESSPMKGMSQHSAITKEEFIMKTWGSCQHIGQIEIPCPMKCFQSPPAVCAQLHDCITSPFGESLSRHYRSPSAASAPCLLRLNTGTVFEPTVGPSEGESTSAPATGWLSRLLSCVGSRKTYETRISRDSAHSGSCSSRQRPSRNPRASQDVPSCASAIQDSSVSNEKASGDNMVTWLPAVKKPTLHSYRPGVLICVYCRRRFRPQSNPPGSCELAPDSARQLVDILTCRPCGRRFISCLYRNISSPSLSDSDLNESLSSPCICCGHTVSSPDIVDNAAFTASTNTIRLDYRFKTSSSSTTAGKRQPPKKPSGRRRRCLLCLIYCLMPCLFCYRSCLACYESCLDRGFVGGRHSVVHHRSQH